MHQVAAPLGYPATNSLQHYIANAALYRE